MTTQNLRALHRRIGLWASLWLVIAGITTLIINHRAWLLPPPGGEGGPYSQYLLSHAYCPSKPDRVLVGTANGLYLSEDGGRQFSEISLPVPARQVVRVAFHPNEPDHFYAVLRTEGIYSSNDSGKLWSKVNFPSAAPIASLDVGFDGSLSVLTEEGLHRRVQDNWTLAPRPKARDPKPGEGVRSFVRAAYNLHDGQFYGKLGVWVTDLVALSLLILVATGLVMWRRLDRSAVSDS